MKIGACPFGIAVFLFLPLLSLPLCVQAAAFQLGEERLEEPQFRTLWAGKRIGILAHHASRDASGQHVVDRVSHLDGAELKMIFAPEHGFRTLADENVGDATDAGSGKPVYSLYGPRRAPTPQMLAQLDLLMIDLQDVGLRYYTYPATVVYVLRACKQAGVPVLLLDRPNPLGGKVVEGAMLDRALADGGLTTIASIPTRHGLTLGELALYLNHELAIDADLTVVPMQGYHRATQWESTGLPWIPPSPALVSPEQVLYYAAFGPLESAHFAVGRGTTNEQAFRVFGAPWVTRAQQKELLSRFEALSQAGLRSAAVDWEVTRAEYEGKTAIGLKLELALAPQAPVFAVTLGALRAIDQTFGKAAGLDLARSMVGAAWVLDAVKGTLSVDKAMQRERAESAEFMRARESSLLYAD